MLTRKEFKQLQKTELNILHEVLRICKILDLRVFAVSGTCLGSVKYSGFIPWDDDIDIALPRKDYEIFIKEANKHLPSYYFLQTHQTDPEYYAQFAKIRDSRTTFVERSACKLNINHGIYIDVFPLDGYPDTVWQQKLFDIKKRLYSLRLSRKYYAKRRSVKWIIMSTILTLFMPSVERTWQRREALYSKIDYDKANIIGNFGNAWGKKEILQKKFFNDTVLMQFEDVEVPIPIGYREYLHKLYGDISIDPPKNEQIPHHYAVMIDVNNSYIDNYELIRNKINEE